LTIFRSLANHALLRGRIHFLADQLNTNNPDAPVPPQDARRSIWTT